jgi:pimeloyl-ACP methyl ester carboxylesterase
VIPICSSLAAALILALGPGGAQELAPLPASEARNLRKAFAEALAEPGGRGVRKLTSLAGKLEAKYALADLLAALREGPELAPTASKPRKVGRKKEELREFGSTVVGYLFESGGNLYRYAVDLPEGYDQGRAWPLLLDPGHGGGKDLDDKGKADFVPFFRGHARSAGLDCIVARTEIIEQVGTGGVRGALPEDEVARALIDCVADIAGRFRLDPDRVYAAGLSQTGYWAWYLGRARPDRWAGLAPMSAVTWQVDRYLENLVGIPVFVLHGDADETCPVEQPRRTCARLEELGGSVRYVEIPGAGHEVGVWKRLGEGLGWLREKERARYPKTIAAALSTTRVSWYWWVRVDELEREGEGLDKSAPSGRLEAAVEGQEVRLRTEGVRRLTLCLASELLDLDQPVEIEWNGKKVHSARVPRSFERTAELALEKADWSALYEAALELRAR